MSHSDVKYEAFLEIVAELLAAGHGISFRRIQTRTGGSQKLVSRYLNRYFDDRLEQTIKLAVSVPSELAKAFNDSVLHQVHFLNQEIKTQLVAQNHVIREVQEINVEFLDRCDEKDRAFKEVQALCESQGKEMSAEREAAARVEDELENKLDELSEECASTRKELVDIKIEKARMTAILEQAVINKVEMENRVATLENELKVTQENLHQQQLFVAAARAESIASEEQLMVLHSRVAQRERDLVEVQERLLEASTRRATAETLLAVKPPVKPPPPGSKNRPKGSKTSKPLAK